MVRGVLLLNNKLVEFAVDKAVLDCHCPAVYLVNMGRDLLSHLLS